MKEKMAKHFYLNVCLADCSVGFLQTKSTIWNARRDVKWVFWLLTEIKWETKVNSQQKQPKYSIFMRFQCISLRCLLVYSGVCVRERVSAANVVHSRSRLRANANQTNATANKRCHLMPWHTEHSPKKHKFHSNVKTAEKNKHFSQTNKQWCAL